MGVRIEPEHPIITHLHVYETSIRASDIDPVYAPLAHYRAAPIDDNNNDAAVLTHPETGWQGVVTIADNTVEVRDLGADSACLSDPHAYLLTRILRAPYRPAAHVADVNSLPAVLHRLVSVACDADGYEYAGTTAPARLLFDDTVTAVQTSIGTNPDPTRSQDRTTGGQA